MREIPKQIKRAAQERLSFLRIPARRISRFLDDSERAVHRGYRIPPRSLRRLIGEDVFQCDDFYLQSTIVEAAKFSTRLGYTKSSRVVEVGCGCGRSATGLLAEFGDVDYFGLDANRDFIDWCKENIEQYHPSFRFQHLDVVHQLYNPRGTLDAADIKLPVASASADIVYMQGVFTNLPPEHAQIYISEVSRIAHHDGRIFLSAFVEEDVPDATINPTGYVPFYDCTVPLNIVRYSKQWLFSLFRKHRLSTDYFHYHGGNFPRLSEIYLKKI